VGTIKSYGPVRGRGKYDIDCTRSLWSASTRGKAKCPWSRDSSFNGTVLLDAMQLDTMLHSPRCHAHSSPRPRKCPTPESKTQNWSPLENGLALKLN